MTWYSRDTLADRVTRLTEPAVHPLLRSNAWHVRGAERDLLIDTGLGVSSLRADHPDLFEREPLLLLTHAHLDHVGCAYELEERLIHPSEASELNAPPQASLFSDRYPQSFRNAMVELGLPPFSDTLLEWLPSPDYDPESFTIRPAPATGFLNEGDIVSTGDRDLLVLHLPGHSPGSVGLLEEKTGILFAGDAVYDEPLLDELPGSNISDYLRTMARLRALDVKVVHAGHSQSFGRTRLIELCQAYIDWREGG